MRLRIKLVLTLTALVFAVVVVLSGLYLAQLLSERIDQTYEHNDIIAHQVLMSTRSALERGMGNYPKALKSPTTMRAAMVATLKSDVALQQVLNSVILYSPTVFDVTVADANGTALISTDPAVQDKPVPPRQGFQKLLAANPWQQFRTVFGPPAVYNIDLSLNRNGEHFITVRVGVRTTFLRSQLAPRLKLELAIIFLALIISIVVAAWLSNVVLLPLQVISDRLDQFMLQAPETDTGTEMELLPSPRDEVSQVSSKIERIGQRMRSVEEVFITLQANLNQVMENLQDGILLFTRDARAIMVSDSVHRFLGMEREQMFGMELHEIFDSRSKLGQVVRRAFNARIPLMQQDVETESGRHIQVSLDFIHGEASGLPGETLGALLTLHDSESIKQIESELEVSRRLADIGRLTSGVGHEVKNPINAIVVHLELLRGKLDRKEAGSERHLDIIQDEIRRLDRVVQTLVDFSRPVDLELSTQDIKHVVSTVLALASPELEQQHVHVISILPPQAVFARVDADLLRQALLNVVLNGAQAMAEGGELEVELRQDGRYATIAVRDQGCGIPKEILDRIFNLYFTTKSNGTGIGLAMTYRILQLHNGSITVESRVDKGTEFVLRLPIAAVKDLPQGAGSHLNGNALPLGRTVASTEPTTLAATASTQGVE